MEVLLSYLWQKPYGHGIQLSREGDFAEMVRWRSQTDREVEAQNGIYLL
jgi:hypothetical protein